MLNFDSKFWLISHQKLAHSNCRYIMLHREKSFRNVMLPLKKPFENVMLHHKESFWKNSVRNMVDKAIKLFGIKNLRFKNVFEINKKKNKKNKGDDKN